ncbi:MAG: hypothetical protein GXY52_05980 [Chloroflexi bacterium]|nr:hypothetical protein [Chloroflexota bacterium]
MLNQELPDAGTPPDGLPLKRGLLVVGGIAALTIIIILAIYFGFIRKRITPPEADQTVPATTETAVAAGTAVATVQVRGRIREYAPGALIAVITPESGNIEQLIITEQTQIVDAKGKPASRDRLVSGASIVAMGTLDSLNRLIARTITVGEAGTTGTPRPTRQVTPSLTPEASAETPTPQATVVPKAIWAASYYDNTELAGEPVLRRNDPVIDFLWGEQPPASGLSASGFGVRWVGRWDFDEGGFRINAYADDAVRVWLDGVLIIDAWQAQPTTLSTADVYLKAGEHELRVEYADFADQAEIRVWWDFRGQFPEWKGEYFTNPNLTGSPVLVRNDQVLLFDWGNSAPAPQVPVDHFSVRWSRSLVFDEGPFRFTTTATDGVRLYVDGNLLIDEWHQAELTSYTGYIYLVRGAHNVVLEYYSHTGPATVKLGWDRIEQFYNWKGEYFNNTNLSGTPALVRDDPVVSFDWQDGSPGATIPADNFSVRWSRTVTLEKGTYRFWADTDDGVRISVDGVLLVNAWVASAGLQQALVTVEAGPHLVVVEFLELGGTASIEFGYDVAPAPTATATATPTEPTLLPEATETATPTVTVDATASATPKPSATP